MYSLLKIILLLTASFQSVEEATVTKINCNSLIQIINDQRFRSYIDYDNYTPSTLCIVDTNNIIQEECNSEGSTLYIVSKLPVERDINTNMVYINKCYEKQEEFVINFYYPKRKVIINAFFKIEQDTKEYVLLRVKGYDN